MSPGRARSRRAAPGSGAVDAAVPCLRMTVLCCMDTRFDDLLFRGLAPGDVHVVRNAGARAGEDAIRSIALSQHVLGTHAVLVVGHVGCHGLEVPGDPEASVARALAAITSAEGIPRRDHVRGVVIDEDGGVVEVSAAAPLSPAGAPPSGGR